MRFRLITVLFGLLLTLAAAAPAYAEATVNHFTFTQTVVFPALNPCTGEEVVIKRLDDVRSQVVRDDAGGVHVTIHGQFELTATDPETGETMDGQGNFHQSVNSPQGEVTIGFNVRSILPGPENNVVRHLLIHVSPNGMKIVKDNFECR